MRIVTIPGSLRTGSYNRKLLQLAIVELEKAKVEIDTIDLKEYAFPLYDGDLEDEQGVPDAVWSLKSKLAAAHGIIIASPEYNAGVPGVLKNVIDWTSRGGSNPWAGKVIGMMGASLGAWGATRMMPHLRDTLTSLNCIVIPQQINVPRASAVWNEEGVLTDQKLIERVERFVQKFLSTTQRLHHEELSSTST